MGIDQEVHKACDRELGGLTEEFRERRGMTLRDGQKSLLMSSMILGATNRKVLACDWVIATLTE